MKDYQILSRAEFILAGFRFEARDDGSCVLYGNVPLKSGEIDSQPFPSFAAFAIWFSAGVSEIETAGCIGDIYIRAAQRKARGD